MSGKAISFLAVLVLSASVALAAPSQAAMGAQMGGGQMNGQMGGQMRGRKGGMNVDEQVARMKSDLNLNNKQTDQVKDLLEKQRRKMQSWRNSHAPATQAEMREHRRQMMTEMRHGMKKILTPKQFKKWEAIRQQRMKRGMRRGGTQAPPQN